MTDGAPPRRLPARPEAGHKGTSGRLLVLAGSSDMPGAAILTVGAALRAGAGLVRALDPEGELRRLLPLACPEAVLATTEDRQTTDPAGRFALGAEHALVCGPGLGPSELTRRRTQRALGVWRAPLLLDADSLNVFRDDLESLRSKEAALVITPHPGEASRLLGRQLSADEADRRDAARALAEATGGTCVLKGRGTLVDDGQRTWIDRLGGAELSCAGSGDVLAGAMGALLCATESLPDARWSPFEAACAAVWAHSRAGQLARGARGPRGVLARDLIERLPEALAELEEGASG